MNDGTRKKKQKFVNISNDQGKDQILPGRHRCKCEARKHALVNNCLSCGRIVCEQEGSGPCFFCKTLVCTNEQWDVINTGSRKGEDIKRSLMAGTVVEENSEDKRGPLSLSSISKSLDKAIQDKNRLVLADKNKSHTRVIDDQSDYFSSDFNPFMSKEDRIAIAKRKEHLLAMQENMRKAQTITIDFAGRRVLNESKEFDFSTDPVLQEIYRKSETGNTSTSNVVHKDILDKIRYDPDGSDLGASAPSAAKDYGGLSRIQDEGPSVASPHMCLSMHQPYASLLVAGIKNFSLPRCPWSCVECGVVTCPVLPVMCAPLPCSKD